SAASRVPSEAGRADGRHREAGDSGEGQAPARGQEEAAGAGGSGVAAFAGTGGADGDLGSFGYISQAYAHGRRFCPLN
ncbi:MAG: hypothetical protein RLZ23_745, partial [Actinomycetota bacterium]